MKKIYQVYNEDCPWDQFFFSSLDLAKESIPEEDRENVTVILAGERSSQESFWYINEYLVDIPIK